MSLDELRALEQAATPGPWVAEEEAGSALWDVRMPDGSFACMSVDEADARFVVAARNALPDLLGRVAAAEAERDALAEALEWYAERRNYAPAGGESEYAAVTARDSFDGEGPGARARAVLAASAFGVAEPTTKETG